MKAANVVPPSTRRRRTLCALLSTFVVATSGCATVTTIQTADPKTAKIFSGTRQDLRAIGGEIAENAKFRAPPPPYPILDLPFSFMLDIVMLPLTLPAAVSRSIPF